VTGADPAPEFVLQPSAAARFALRHSLKKAIASLRRSFGALGSELILTDGGPVALNHALIDIEDLTTPAAREALSQSELFEGLDDIRDEEFQDWLRQKRYDVDAALDRVAAGRMGEAPLPLRLSIAIEQARCLDGDPRVSFVGDLILNRLMQLMRQEDNFDVLDLRSGVVPEMYASCTLVLRVLSHSGKLVLSLSVNRLCDNQVLLGREQVIEEADLLGDRLQSWLVQIADQTNSAMMRFGASDDQADDFAARKAATAIETLLRHGGPALATVEHALETATATQPRGVYYAWLAYLSAFKFEELKGLSPRDWLARTDALAEKSLALDPGNPLSRALLGHVYGFVFKDFHKAAEILRPIEANPGDQPMAYQALSLFKFYTGDVAGARHLAQVGRNAGTFHPFSYGLSTTCAMIDLVKGDFARAAQFGEEALQRQQLNKRTYEPTLRYLAAAYTQLDAPDRARDLWGKLFQQSSEQAQLRAVEGGSLSPNPVAAELVAESFQRMRAQAF
ncbi:MAG: hypothetical protein AAGP08_17995, partial [Pseudomonadota bacterium]